MLTIKILWDLITLSHQVTAGTATQIILQQNAVLEKKIADIEAEKTLLQKKLSDSVSNHTDASKALGKEAEDLKILVNDLESKLRDKEKEIEDTRKRLLFIPELLSVIMSPMIY